MRNRRKSAKQGMKKMSQEYIIEGLTFEGMPYREDQLDAYMRDLWDLKNLAYNQPLTEMIVMEAPDQDHDEASRIDALMMEIESLASKLYYRHEAD